MIRRHRRLLVAFAMLGAPAAQAAASLSDCAAIERDKERLACYDSLARPARAAEAAPGAHEPLPPSALARHWELNPETKRGVFALRTHRPNYILPAHYTTSPNASPFGFLSSNSPNRGLGLDHAEIKFQLSLKVKVLENLFDNRADLWLGYTQQSHWQAYNGGISRPFRETDYQPEAMLVFPTDYRFLGLTGRFVNVGIAHQSNGRSAPLSRSWNRVYVQAGFERGDFALLVRPWYRIREDAATDDNPDITDYLGYGDVVAAYRHGRQEFSGLVRHSFRTGRGSTELGWAFPLHGNLKGYLQLFSGYGESLIDYNHRQNSIGVGVLLSNWL